MKTVIKYIMEAGFDAEKGKGKRKPQDAELQELPAGVWRYPKGYSVAYTDSNEIKRRKYVSSLEEALKFHADPTNYDESSDDNE